MVAQHAAGRADNLRGSWIDQSTFAPFRPWQAFPMLSGDGCSHHLRTFGSALDRSGLDVEQVQSSVSCVINYIFTTTFSLRSAIISRYTGMAGPTARPDLLIPVLGHADGNDCQAVN